MAPYQILNSDLGPGIVAEAAVRVLGTSCVALCVVRITAVFSPPGGQQTWWLCPCFLPASPETRVLTLNPCILHIFLHRVVCLLQGRQQAVGPESWKIIQDETSFQKDLLQIGTCARL